MDKQRRRKLRRRARRHENRANRALADRVAAAIWQYVTHARQVHHPVLVTGLKSAMSASVMCRALDMTLRDT